MKKEYIKPIIIVGIIAFTYLIVMLVVFGDKSEKLVEKDKPENNSHVEVHNEEESEDEIFSTIVLPDNPILKETNNGWKIGKNKDITDLRFDLYADSLLYSDYKIVYNKNLSFYDEYNNPKYIEEKVIGVSSDKSFENVVLENDEITIEDKNVVSNYLNTLKINFDINEIYISKFNYDYNGDYIRETIYSVGNVSGLDEESGVNQDFSIIFVKKSNGFESLFNETSDVNVLMSITSVFKLDDTLYIVATGDIASDGGKRVILFEVNENSIFNILDDVFK